MANDNSPEKDNNSPENAKKLRQIQQSLGEALPQILQRGFHGRLKLAISIQDGTIQDFRRNIVKFER
jgi:hypothetical protein